MVDRNLFPFDLAIVAILKSEGPYLKEWLDYHLMAGVDHFYLYDNESTDNQAAVAAPYVKAGLVDYINAPGKKIQYAVYNDAVKRFKFHCRYMAFIDGDEFVYPKVDGGGHTIIDIVDEILSPNQHAAGLAINWQIFGSNGQETADYSRGVLERFTRRAPNPEDCSVPLEERHVGINTHIKTVADPRKINFMNNPHCAYYFEECCAVNEDGDVVQGVFNNPVTAKKIVVNHYHTKSYQEYEKKISRGMADSLRKRDLKHFDVHDRNEVFDDGILKYRDERKQIYQPPDKSRAAERLLNTLIKNLLPTLLPTTPTDFYLGKMENFLTCRAVAALLKSQLVDDTPAKFFEEALLKAILKSFEGMNFVDARIFLRELPKILCLPYPAVKEIRAVTLQLIPQMVNVFRVNNMWKNYVELDYLQDILKVGG